MKKVLGYGLVGVISLFVMCFDVYAKDITVTSDNLNSNLVVNDSDSVITVDELKGLIDTELLSVGVLAGYTIEVFDGTTKLVDGDVDSSITLVNIVISYDSAYTHIIEDDDSNIVLSADGSSKYLSTSILVGVEYSSITIKGDGALSEYATYILVESGTHEVILDNVSLDATGEEFSPIVVKSGASVTFTLLNDSVLIGDEAFAGINVEVGGDLVIDGDGSISATGGVGAAGIGGNESQVHGNITILSGNVDAIASPSVQSSFFKTSLIGANGIGNGSLSSLLTFVSSGSINITGGVINAVGDNNSGINTFSSSGNATIYADDTYSLIDPSTFDGILVDGDTIYVGGNQVVSLTNHSSLHDNGEWIIASGSKLVILDGASLTIESGLSVENNGTIVIEGVLNIDGKLLNNGVIEGAGDITGGHITSSDGYSELYRYTIKYSDTDIDYQFVTGFDKVQFDSTKLEKTGYTYEWYNNGIKYEEVSASHVVLSLVFTVNSYNITFVDSLNSNSTSIVVDYGSVVSNIGNPSKENYLFLGWYLNGSLYDFNTLVTGDIQLAATYRVNNLYVVSSGNAQSVECGSSTSVSYVVDADLSKLESIVLGGVVIDSSNYTVNTSNNTITLNGDYVMSLTEGTKVFTLNFSDGYASVSTIVKATVVLDTLYDEVFDEALDSEVEDSYDYGYSYDDLEEDEEDEEDDSQLGDSSGFNSGDNFDDRDNNTIWYIVIAAILAMGLVIMIYFKNREDDELK